MKLYLAVVAEQGCIRHAKLFHSQQDFEEGVERWAKRLKLKDAQDADVAGFGIETHRMKVERYSFSNGALDRMLGLG